MKIFLGEQWLFRWKPRMIIYKEYSISRIDEILRGTCYRYSWGWWNINLFKIRSREVR